ncbi:LOW QUALITY PROTEIN: cysteine-rich repeat secretory protein 15-like [Asparagus officinalis]|uniref:LOW QUALITY PROTEIN: cysteine-rich repeat secretory protein 15-like n=1 Tax=Asparagus officinalis TaxID=4686 RepID=UPI00098DEE9D|nr:LOW QUALITY PROTEIN: cysteine-rich repeat secretory protein 15-like [Asparagus officinalis]
MSPPSFVSVSLFFFFFFFTLRLHQARAGSSFIYAGCSPSKFELNSLYQSHLNSLLASVAFSASQTSYKDFPDSDVYGLYQCRNDLSSSDCSACVQSAVGQLSLVCAQSYAASLQLDGCFFGTGNRTSLARKPRHGRFRPEMARATPATGEFLRRRDDVLDDLQAARAFRVSGSGRFRATAQCLGDLERGGLRRLSRRGRVGDLRMRRDPRNLFQHKGNDEVGKGVQMDGIEINVPALNLSKRRLLTRTDYTDDDIGKTVAIIVGILAGLAVIVVLLSFLKKACIEEIIVHSAFNIPHNSFCCKPMRFLWHLYEPTHESYAMDDVKFSDSELLILIRAMLAGDVKLSDENLLLLNDDADSTEIPTHEDDEAPCVRVCTPAS